MHNETDECTVLNIDHDDLRMHYFPKYISHRSIIKHHHCLGTHDCAYHTTLQESGFSYEKFYQIHECSNRVIENTDVDELRFRLL